MRKAFLLLVVLSTPLTCFAVGGAFGNSPSGLSIGQRRECVKLGIRNLKNCINFHDAWDAKNERGPVATDNVETAEIQSEVTTTTN